MLRLTSRFALLLTALFSAGTVSVVVLATEGLGSEAYINLPEQVPSFTGSESQTETLPTATLNEVVERRPVFEPVPLPHEVSTNGDVIATNFLLTAFLVVLLGIVSTMLNNLIREKEDRIQQWMQYFYVDRFFQAFRLGTRQSIRKGCLGAPLIIIVFAIYGILFAYVEEGLNIFQPEDLQLAIVLAMSVALISLSGDVAQRQVARFWRRTSRYGVYPSNLGVAFLTTIVSRLFGLTPGIMFGTPAGVDVDFDDEPRLREGVLALTTLIVILGLGAFGWGITALIDAGGDQSYATNLLEFSAPLVMLAQTLGFALMVMALQTAFFEMAPVSLTMGSQLFRWNALIWLALAIPVTFAFCHVLINPGSEYLEAYDNVGVALLTVVVVLLTLITTAAWVFFTYVEPPRLPNQTPRPAPPVNPPYQQRPPSPPTAPSQRPAVPPPPPPVRRPYDDQPPPPVRRPYDDQ